MKPLLELQENRSHLIRTSRDIVERAKKDNERALTQDEQTELAGLQKDIAATDIEIQQRTIFDKVDQTTQLQMDTIVTSRVTIPTNPNGNGEVPEERAIPAEARRFGKLRAFKGPHGERDAYRSGIFLMAALFNNEYAQRRCREQNVDYRALAVGVNTAGGFLVPIEMSTAIIDLRENYGVFRRECDVVPMSRDIQEIPRTAGRVTATFTAENAALTESDPTLNQVVLTARKLGALTRISSELAEDAIVNMADRMAMEFAWAFAKKEDDLGFKGTGSAADGSIRGINVKIIDGTHTAGAVDAATNIDTFAEVTLDDLHSLMGALPEFAEANAKWYCSRPCKALVFDALAAAAGGNTITTLAGKIEPTFLGYPVVVSQSMPTTTGDLSNLVMLLFGDLRQCATLGDRRQITVAMSTDRYFVEDQIAIKATERLDINAHDLGDNTDAGPIVALIGE